MARVYIGIGSNLGQREENIRRALDLLNQDDIRVIKVSRVIETQPVGGPPQGPYLNAAAELETSLSPKELLSRLKSIEKELGREPTKVLYAPRPIDLDILLYDHIHMDSPELTIPHPRMHDRAFVMIPLSELQRDSKAKECSS